MNPIPNPEAMVSKRGRLPFRGWSTGRVGIACVQRGHLTPTFPYDFVNFRTQVHDFDPGIFPYPDGLFWTVAIPPDAVSIELGAGRARYAMTDMAMPDYFNIPNAIFRFQDPVSVESSCTFDIRWSGPVTDRSDVSDPDVGFEGQFLLNQATMTWSAHSADGFSFVSNPTPTTSAFAMIGRERNGIFFGE